MTIGDLKSNIDRVWDAFWPGGISNPLEVIEQVTYLQFIRRLAELQTLAESNAKSLATIEIPVPSVDLQRILERRLDQIRVQIGSLQRVLATSAISSPHKPEPSEESCDGRTLLGSVHGPGAALAS